MKGIKIMAHYKPTRKYFFPAVLFLIVMTQVFAAPRPINYQGYLTQPDGSPVNTIVAMEVELWTAATAGTLLYSESHAAVMVSSGRFSIEISTGTPVSGSFEADQFQQDTWLALTINGELLNPRTRLGSVAGSIHSEVAERLSTSCADGEWVGFRGGGLACYECSAPSTRTCYEGPSGTGNVGACRQGLNTCVDGAYSSGCTGQVLPAAEICNSSDDDCNGLADDGTSLPGCLNQYIDTDGDGFGDDATPVACLCTQASGTTDIGGDCDDSDGDVRPDQTLYSVHTSNSGGYDYNCNGALEKKESFASCTYNGSSCDYVPGFVDSIPNCGQFGAHSSGCSQDGAVCTVTTSAGQQRMACR